MKWNMVFGALLVSVSLSSQSFGFELLDRMLGFGGGGCRTGCCDKGCGPACEPACGCEAQVACDAGCCDPCADCCGKKRRSWGGFFARKKQCCKTSCYEPACGCEAAGEPACCDPCGGCKKRCRKRMALLDMFRCRKCCEPACGCEAACEPACGCGYNGQVPAGNGYDVSPEGGEAAPMPPAPMADPAAMVPNRGRVVPAASLYR